MNVVYLLFKQNKTNIEPVPVKLIVALDMESYILQKGHDFKHLTTMLRYNKIIRNCYRNQSKKILTKHIRLLFIRIVVKLIVRK